MLAGKLKTSWNLIFWTTHFLSWAGLILPLFLMTPIIEGFTFGLFHNTVSILEFVIVFFTLGCYRTLLNRYIDWKNVNFIVIFKIIFFAIIGGVILQLVVYHSLHLTRSNFFPTRTIPNMYFGGEELRFMDTILKTFSWIFGFFTIKMMINYNAYKLEGIALIDKVKEEEINTISGQIDADFMSEGIELTKRLVLTDVKKARKTLTQLSNVLRYNLTQENFEHVTIQEELVVISDYIDLVRGQCDHDLTYEVTIPNEFLNVLITPMKFKNVIKKIINRNTTSLHIGMKGLGNTYGVVIKTINDKEKKAAAYENESHSKDLNSLFSEYEKFQLTIVNNAFNVYFEISKTNQNISSYV